MLDHVCQNKQNTNNYIPEVTKECFLEALKYLTSKQQPFVTPACCFKTRALGVEDLEWLTLEALEHAFNLEEDLKKLWRNLVLVGKHSISAFGVRAPKTF